MERDNDLEKKKERIQEMIRNTKPFTKLNTQICNKKIIILLGRTRAGKSTLANYLLDYELTSVREEIANTFKLENTGQGPQIGKGSVSTTTIPTVPTLSDGSILIDSPGFEDNRGISQDIFNAICMNHIRFAKSVKFVLVCYIGDLVNDNVQGFTTLLKKTADLVVNVDMISKSICIIFTKDEKNRKLDHLKKLMETKILKEEKLAVDKRLLPTFTENSNLIGIFKSPQQEGIIDVKELDVNVKKAINACIYVNVNNLKIQSPLAAESKIFLNEIFQYYKESTYFKTEIERTLECIINYWKVDEYVFASYGKELDVVKHELLNPLAKKLVMLFENDINNLEELKVALETLLEVRKLKLSTKFKSDFAFIFLLENALLLEEHFQKHVIENFKNSISKLLDKILHLISRIDDECSRRIDENVLLLYEAKNFKRGVRIFHIGYLLTKAKIVNSVRTVQTPDTKPLTSKELAKIVDTGIDIGKVTDAVAVGVDTANSTNAEIAAFGVTAGAVEGAATGAGADDEDAPSASRAGAVGTAVVEAVVDRGTGFGAAVAGVAGGTAVAGVAAFGAASSGAVAIGATAGAAGIFATGAGLSAIYSSIQNCLTKRYKTRRKQERKKNNENYSSSA